MHLSADREQAFQESKRFLDIYYTTDFSREALERSVAMGSPEECVKRVLDFRKVGVGTLTIRFPAWDQKRQLRMFLKEVAPALKG